MCGLDKGSLISRINEDCKIKNKNKKCKVAYHFNEYERLTLHYSLRGFRIYRKPSWCEIDRGLTQVTTAVTWLKYCRNSVKHNNEHDAHGPHRSPYKTFQIN